jgi:hypothetical protein
VSLLLLLLAPAGFLVGEPGCAAATDAAAVVVLPLCASPALLI